MSGKKSANVMGDRLTLFFQCKVSSIQQIQLNLLQIVLVGIRAFGWKIIVPNDRYNSTLTERTVQCQGEHSNIF
jgi:hypothetical protein